MGAEGSTQFALALPRRARSGGARRRSLSQDDLQRVDDVRTALTTYRKLDNEEFVRLGDEAKPVK